MGMHTEKETKTAEGMVEVLKWVAAVEKPLAGPNEVLNVWSSCRR